MGLMKACFFAAGLQALLIGQAQHQVFLCAHYHLWLVIGGAHSLLVGEALLDDYIILTVS